MRKFIIGSFVGCVLAVSFLAACGSGGGMGGIVEVLNAIDVLFDNSASGLAAENVQAAIDETATTVGTFQTNLTAVEDDVTTLQGDINNLQNADSTLSGRVTTLEDNYNALTAADSAYSNTTSGLTATDVQAAIDEIAPALTAAGTSYDNTTSGLTATDTKAALDELATGDGYIFTRWGAATAPTGTTLVYSGIGAVGPDGGNIFVFKGGDPGGNTTDGQSFKFAGTATSAGRLPPGVTGDRRIKAAVCVSPTPVTTIFGTHTPPTGWSIVYKGYAMSDGQNMIVVDGDNFDGTAAAAGGETVNEFYLARLQNPTHDSTNYPYAKLVKAAVISRN